MDDTSPSVDALNKPPLRFWRTRIALSVFFGVLMILLCVLWVRSYATVDVLYGNLPGIGAFEIYSGEGRLELLPGPRNRGWGTGSQSTEDRRKRIEVMRKFNILNGGAGQVQIPIMTLRHGFLAVVAGLIFALVQLTHLLRFSLRTMLIATTFVAVMLGLAVWLFR